MTRHHPPAVYAAAKDGFRAVLRGLEALPWQVSREEAATFTTGAVRSLSRSLLREGRREASLRSLDPYETAARILGASAAPAVLRVRGRRAAGPVA